MRRKKRGRNMKRQRMGKGRKCSKKHRKNRI
jgi:hypothetical protein